jgi:hypothetical protein
MARRRYEQISNLDQEAGGQPSVSWHPARRCGGAVAGVSGFRPETRQALTNRRNSKRTGLFSEFNTSQITLVEISSAVLSAAGKKKAESL